MTAILYLCNVLLFSLPLAIFEIWLEGYKTGSWGKTEFSDRFFLGKKIDVSKSWLGRVLEKEYFEWYHVTMFGIVMPLLVFLNYLLLTPSNRAVGNHASCRYENHRTNLCPHGSGRQYGSRRLPLVRVAILNGMATSRCT